MAERSSENERIRLAVLERDMLQVAQNLEKLTEAIETVSQAMVRFAAAEERAVEDRQAIKELGRRVGVIESNMPGLMELRQYAVRGLVGVFALVCILVLGAVGLTKTGQASAAVTIPAPPTPREPSSHANP